MTNNIKESKEAFSSFKHWRRTRGSWSVKAHRIVLYAHRNDCGYKNKCCGREARGDSTTCIYFLRKFLDFFFSLVPWSLNHAYISLIFFQTISFSYLLRNESAMMMGTRCWLRMNRYLHTDHFQQCMTYLTIFELDSVLQAY